MKTIKHLFVSAAAAVACGFAALPGMAGDILEIRPCDEFGYSSLTAANNVNQPYTTIDSPLGSGKDLYFSVRLVAREEIPTAETEPYGYYALEHTSKLTSETNDLYTAPLSIGLCIGENARYAELVTIRRTPQTYPTTIGETVTPTRHLFDVIFHYRTQPGDQGLPIRLMLANGEPVPENYNTSGLTPPTVEYAFKNKDKWAIRYHSKDGTTVSAASFIFNPSPAATTDDKPEDDTLASNYSLEECGFYVQTLKFANSARTQWEDPSADPDGYWKSVAKGHTKSGDVEVSAKIEKATKFYVWAVDPTWLAAAEAGTGTFDVSDVAVTMYGENVSSATITVGYDKDSGNPITASVNMFALEMQGGQEGPFSFQFKGLIEDKNATLILSTTPDFLWKTGTGYTLKKDFVEIPVRSVKSEPELILETTESKTTYMVTSAYKTKITTLKLTLTDDYTETFKATITPRIQPKTGKTSSYAWNEVVHISEDNGSADWSWAQPIEVEFKNGKADTDGKEILVYGVGAAGQTMNEWYDNDNGCRIEFDITVPAAVETFLTGGIKASPIYVKPEDPVVKNAADLAEVATRGGVALPITITVSDNYTDINDDDTGYTVKFLAPGATEEDVVTLTKKDGTAAIFKPDELGVLYALDDTKQYTTDRPAIPGDVTTGDAELWLVAPNKTTSERVSMHLTVTPPATVSATAYATDETTVSSTQYKEYNGAEDEPVKAYIGITLTEKYNKGDIYAFLKLADTTKAAYVEGDCIINDTYTSGIPIENTSSAGRGEITFKDGLKKGTTLKFTVVLCKSETYDATQIVDDYKSTELTLRVSNVDPTVNDIRMNGWRLNAAKTGFRGVATVGISQTFKFDIGDAELDMDTLQIEYQFTDGNTTDAPVTLTGDPSTWDISRKFKTVGTESAAISYTITDKDGGEITGSVPITVSANPFVSITGDVTAFDEKEHPMYTLALSEAADEELNVRVTVTRSLKNGTGDIELSGGTPVTVAGAYAAYDFTFAAGETAKLINVSDADGTETSVFDFQAVVTTDTVKPGTTDTKWCDFYTKGTLGPISVNNLNPAIWIQGFGSYDENTEITNSTSVAIGNATTLKWKVTDVTKDLAGTVAVSIMDEAEDSPHEFNMTDSTIQTFHPTFKNSGNKKVVFQATDKDDGLVTVTIVYPVEAAKMLNAWAVGPSKNGAGNTYSLYYQGSGRGEGHIYVNQKCADANRFLFEYNCGLNSYVTAIAQGYRVGDIDNGTLTLNGAKDIPINPEGGIVIDPTTPQYYTYADEKDSFFYCWIKTSTDEQGNDTSALIGVPAPEVTDAAQVSVTLPTKGDDTTGAFALTTIEAIFAKEYLASDNVGDINADGIPDVYAFGFDGFGISAEDSTDMNSLADFNDDGDYLPYALDKTVSSFIFMPTNSWADGSRKFTAALEIRGMDEHLNNAYQILAGDNPSGKNFAGRVQSFTADMDPATTFSALEYDAYVQAGKPAGWSPERPTDPTKSDTDGDGLSDAYEYYIWYKAHVGWMDGNSHKYISGRKYNPADPFQPYEITPATIESIYDPLSRNDDILTTDTDDDGITDYAEFVLGTNPFDFDTDGDGLPDGYEVSITGTDPCKTDSNSNGVSDANENPDGDAMAALSKSGPFVSVVADNGMLEYYWYDGSADDCTLTVDATVLTGTLFDVTVGDHTYTLITTRDWATSTYVDADGNTRLCYGFNSRNTWQCSIDEGTGEYVRSAVPTSAQIAPSTIATNVRADGEYHDQHINCTGLGQWYVAFNYGSYYARGKTANLASFVTKPVLTYATAQSINYIHYQVYQAEGFNPQVGWMPDNKSFSNMEEFMTMVFFYRMGSITVTDMTPQTEAPVRTRLSIWQNNATSPTTADSDGDKMPDGWELYLMAKTGIAGPGSSYSPLYSFNKITVAATRDNDGDALEWPAEYSGTSSSAQYGWTVVQGTWRNKSMPTDPWDDDTDGDGIRDGSEGGNVINEDDWQGQYASSFLYNTQGKAGGGLNPLSWDTDGDGLPDPWELEFHGTYSASSSGTVNSAVPGSTNTTSLLVGNTCVWNMDGMDGTVTDARLDYDGDGLANWQEYMTGTMRCWRYDDCVNPWTSQTAMNNNLPQAGTDEWNQYWAERLLDEHNEGGKYNPHLVNGYFDPGMYMTRCSKSWDSASGRWYYLHDGVNHNLSKGMTNPTESPTVYKVRYSAEAWDAPTYTYVTAPLHYISTDPRVVDSDGDGMDDYYELFHGMNPLLGLPGKTKATVSAPFNACDLVFDAYARYPHKPGGGGSYASALNNWWCNDKLPHTAADIKHPELGGYDFLAYPWLNGIASADPDGDNIVNIEESILPNVQAAATYHHTDPTPLWMTDSSYTNSLTRRYYRNAEPEGAEYTGIMIFTDMLGERTFNDPVSGIEYNLDDFECFTYDQETGLVTFEYDGTTFGNAGGWMFSFEENEGYDSDHDYLSDYEEGQGKTKNASDPQNHDDPLRRQAMYFNGTDAFLQKPVDESETPVNVSLNSEARQNFLYYTVECWAKPDEASLANDNKLRTLVERAIYADNASAADELLMRKNFLIGIKNGRWYTCFDSTGTDKQSVEVTDGPTATTAWTHIAATYDGTALRLYVDGQCKKVQKTSVQPEHGVAALAVTGSGAINPRGYTTYFSDYYISILVGASAMTKEGLVFDSAWRQRSYVYATDENPEGLSPDATTLADYGNFYKGYIDEVRIWDGARSDADIYSDYENRTRYTAELAARNRDEVFLKWVDGATRAPTSEKELPAQLMYHWAFDHLPSAIETADVIQVPAGFNTAKTVTNARAKWSRPADYTERNWESTAVRSTVYTDCAWVPWINNTVSHLPRFDQTTLDSVYWSENYAGTTPASSYGYTSFGFPRTAEVPSRWTQMTYADVDYYDSHRDPYFDIYNGITKGVLLNTTAYTQDSRWHTIMGYESSYTYSDAFYRMRFTLRDHNVCGDDLLPMGGAYPRRISSAEGGMWDDATASDAWAQTGNDADNNGLPDWWEEYARQNYCPGLAPEDPLEWGTTVTYDGVDMPAYQAYLRDMARGLVKIGATVAYRDEYADMRDLDGDNMLDWWEDMYGIDTGVADDAKADPDHDGLSNYQEYLVSEVCKWYNINPALANSTDADVPTDYFLKVADGRYLGETKEIRADHDFMEDLSEDQIGNDRTKYDPYIDNDEDGWGAWSELRYSTYKQSTAARLISHLVGETEVRDFPIPVIHATLRYNGKSTSSNATIIVDAYTGNDLTAQPSATFKIKPGNAETRYYNLGFYEDRVVHGTLTPGHLAAGLNNVSLQEAFVQSDDLFTWTVVDIGNGYTNQTTTTGTYAEMYKVVQTLTGDSYVYLSEEEFSWDDIIYTPTGNHAMSLTVDDQTQKGHFMLANGERLGEVDLTTGDFTFDFTVLRDLYMGNSNVSFQQYYFRIAYKSVLPTMQSRKLQVSLATPDTGNLVEGSTTFVAYMDVDGNGAYTPDTDPIGFVKNVDIGWDNVPELTIEMTDDSQAAGKRFEIADGIDTVRVIRTTVNGEETLEGNPVKRRIVYSRDLTSVNRKTVWEGDLISSDKFGLDWDFLRGDLDAMDGVSLKDVTSVGYVVVTNVGSVLNIEPNTIIDSFTVTYSGEAATPKCIVPSAAKSSVVQTARPTFIWSAAEGYTAFQLQIADASGSWIYTNSLQKLPPCDIDGNYRYTAPVFVSSSPSADSWSLANNSNYQWRVAMFNAKFTPAGGDTQNWSEPTAFTTGLAETNDFSTLYGSARVNVRYFGPETDALKNVIVQLYKTADFTGTPAAQTRLSEVDGTIGTLTNGQTVAFHGLEDGTYYAVAFVDRDGDSVRDRFEIWGYAAQVGKGKAAIWTPTALDIDASCAKIPSIDLIMEDTDLNANDVLDGEDPIEDLQAATSTTVENDDDADNDGLTGKEEKGDTYTDPNNADTDGDGMFDGWEAKFAGTDPLLKDGDTVSDGDVMAYVELDAVRITDVDGKTYLLANPNQKVNVGDAIALDDLVNTYDYPVVKGSDTNAVTHTYWGIGTNYAGTATVRIKKIEKGTSVLVHAQVYEAFGFDETTATAVEGAVNTKPFTAVDKYLVLRYLEAIGLGNEDSANRNKAWSACTLKPGVTDFDGDGVSDGWELYVMFGPKGPSKTGITFSPWIYADARDRALDVDVDGLNLLEEFDGGYYPTDPWEGDSHGYGLGDKAVHDYGLKGENAYRVDDDNDQLANFIEYLISNMTDFPVIDANEMSTFDGQLVPDYFLRHGSLYLGEMFADHDMIEDWWEDEQPTEIASGSQRLANYSRYVYDAVRDSDGDGWNNWQECRATMAGGWTNIVTVVSNETGVVTNETMTSLYQLAGARPVPTVPVTVAYNGTRGSLKGLSIVLSAWNQDTLAASGRYGSPDATWVFPAGDTHPLNMTTNLAAATSGFLRSGKTLFVAYAAAGGSTDAATTTVPAYTPGQPYGVAKDIRVDYLMSAPLAIELTDVNAAMVRLDLVAAAAAQMDSVSGFDGLDLEDVRDDLARYLAAPTNKVDSYTRQYLLAMSNAFNAVAACTDRGVNVSDYATLGCPITMGTNLTFVSSNIHVRVLRSSINDQSAIYYKSGLDNTAKVYYFSSSTPSFDGYFDLQTHPTITEADLLATDTLDLDWGTVGKVYDGCPKAGYTAANVTSAGYRIVIGESTGNILTNNNLLSVLVVNHFELGKQPTAAANLAVSAYGSQPTFSWTHKNTINKMYPAFQLRVYDGKTIVYDSGAMKAPVRDGQGRYNFTAPIWPGMMTESGIVIEADKDYTWKVTMLDAKFTDFPSNAASGTMRIMSSGALSDYGQIAVGVKYMGPGTVATTGSKNLIRVEAYTSSDFSGVPYGVGYVRHTDDEFGRDSLAASDRIELNALLTGLLKGQDYYIRAYLDTDGDGERDDWESWGYVNYVGTEQSDVYSPRAVSLVGDAYVPTCVIYIEDTDTNNNHLPDVWEWNNDGKLGGDSTAGVTAASPYVVTIDDSGAAATNILWAVAQQTGAVQLPYYAMLTRFENGNTIPSLSLALAMAGIDLNQLETTPEVSITSFSLTDGITFEVDTRATVDGEILVPKAVKVEVTLTLQLQQTDSLAAGWQDVGDPVVKTFTISETTTLTDASINETIKKLVDEKKGSGFFRVNVTVGSKLAE